MSLQNKTVQLTLLMGSIILAIAFVLLPHSAKAATYTVTSTDDAGAGTLRQAITDANANAGADQIDFAISGAGPHTIVLASGLSITDQVKVNGLSQSGSVCNGTSSSLKIVIEGYGIGVSANNSEINGLVLGAISSTAMTISDNVSGVKVRCNFFGTSADGTAAVSTISHSGLDIIGDGATIGGDNVTDMNLFGKYFPWIEGDNITFKNNIVGTDIAGTTSLGIDSYGGINVAPSTGTTIANNLISGVIGRGISFWYGTHTDTVIKGNKIGTNYAGTAALPNTNNGIGAYGGFINLMIGGPNVNDGNVISGNSNYGVAISINDATIENNFIGTNAAGTAKIPNAGHGLSIGCSGDCSGVLIKDNVIGGNTASGIGMGDGIGARIQGNHIGTNLTNTLDLGNGEYGIHLTYLAAPLIGGTGAGQGNTIAFNGANGIGMIFYGSGHSPFLGNSIFSNNYTGIKLGGGSGGDNYPTPNDAGDSDTGPNDKLNYPIITQATENSGNTNIGFSLDVPAGDYRIEFFSNTTADPTGYGEGETFIGYTNATSDGNGNQNFSTTITGTGHTHLAATTTLIDAGTPSGFGSTSEFGKYEPQADLAVTSDDGTTSAVYGESHQYNFTVTNNGPGDVDQFTFQGANNVINPYTYTVDAQNSTATTTGSFDGNTWSGLLKSGETLTLLLSGDVQNFGNLETSQVCIDPPIRLGGQTIIDTVDSNNCGTDDDTYVPTPVVDLAINKTLDAPATIKNGQQATYTISLTNNGPNASAGGFYIYDVLPDGIEYSTVIGDNATCMDPHEPWPFPGTTGHYIVCIYAGDSITVGQTVSFKMVVNVESIDESQVTLNHAMVFYELDPEAQALGQAFGAGQDPFTTLSNNSIVIHTYDPNAPVDDNDGVPSEIESAAPNNGDANGDNTLDSEQANVASFVDPVTEQYATLEVGSECSITAASTAAESANTTPDSNYNYPAGLMNFSLSCGTPGITTTVTQYYYSVANQDFLLRKYNPNTNTYTNIDNATITGISVGGQSATKASYQITDGSSLDTDGATDGNITDPTGLAVSESLLAKTGINTHKTMFIIFSIALVAAGIAGLVTVGGQRAYAKKRNSRI